MICFPCDESRSAAWAGPVAAAAADEVFESNPALPWLRSVFSFSLSAFQFFSLSDFQTFRPHPRRIQHVHDGFKAGKFHRAGTVKIAVEHRLSDFAVVAGAIPEV